MDSPFHISKLGARAIPVVFTTIRDLVHLPRVAGVDNTEQGQCLLDRPSKRTYPITASHGPFGDGASEVVTMIVTGETVATMDAVDGTGWVTVTAGTVAVIIDVVGTE